MKLNNEELEKVVNDLHKEVNKFIGDINFENIGLIKSLIRRQTELIERYKSRLKDNE